MTTLQKLVVKSGMPMTENVLSDLSNGIVKDEILHIHVREEYEGNGIMRGLLDRYPLPLSHIHPGNFIDQGLYEKVCSILLER